MWNHSVNLIINVITERVGGPADQEQTSETQQCSLTYLLKPENVKLLQQMKSKKVPA